MVVCEHIFHLGVSTPHYKGTYHKGNQNGLRDKDHDDNVPTATKIFVHVGRLELGGCLFIEAGLHAVRHDDEFVKVLVLPNGEKDPENIQEGLIGIVNEHSKKGCRVVQLNASQKEKGLRNELEYGKEGRIIVNGGRDHGTQCHGKRPLGCRHGTTELEETVRPNQGRHGKQASANEKGHNRLGGLVVVKVIGVVKGQAVVHIACLFREGTVQEG